MSTDKISFSDWGESMPDVPEEGRGGQSGSWFGRKKKTNVDEAFVSVSHEPNSKYDAAFHQ
eukprot:SAG31_NODE_15494_length_752_cov_1.145482_1_plen_61_part_00